MRQSIKILFADDEIGYAKAVPNYLKSKKIDYQIDFAQTVEDAIDYLVVNSCDYDLLIVDLKFRQEDLAGLKILRYLAEKSIEIPSIIITAYANAKNLLECIKERPYKLIEKPFSLRDLSGIVKEVLKKAAIKEERPHLARTRKLVKQLTEKSKIKLIIEAIETLSLETYDDLMLNLPTLRTFIEEEEPYREEMEEEDYWEKEGKKQGEKIPLSILERANYYLEYKTRKLVSGEIITYGPYLYVRWTKDGEPKQYYGGPVEKVSEPRLIEKLYDKYQQDEEFRKSDKLNSIPILYQKYCVNSPR